MSKGVRVRCYYSKTKEVREMKSLVNTRLSHSELGGIWERSYLNSRPSSCWFREGPEKSHGTLQYG